MYLFLCCLDSIHLEKGKITADIESYRLKVQVESYKSLMTKENVEKKPKSFFSSQIGERVLYLVCNFLFFFGTFLIYRSQFLTPNTTTYIVHADGI